VGAARIGLRFWALVGAVVGGHAGVPEKSRGRRRAALLLTVQENVKIDKNFVSKWVFPEISGWGESRDARSRGEFVSSLSFADDFSGTV
jgi:hypothetical protein